MATKNIKAGPTKRFFVKMLTRDIDLADAILDLLDNCVDGIVRELRRQGTGRIESETPYDGYWAKITARPDRFEICDNCGGIPEEIAEEYAFMLGSPDLGRDADIETVGMYGIGMKRAMFKMGQECEVVSHPAEGDPYKVDIPADWLEQDDNWELKLTGIANGFQSPGTKIVISNLYDGIKRQFDSEKLPFLGDLEKEIARHYALILEKGFAVTLNDTKIEPVSLTILTPKSVGATEVPAIEPYVLVGNFDGIDVDLSIGFYRPLATEQQLDDEHLMRNTRERAGWTVICNDRVVLYNDKSAKTGWGTGAVPGYHNQFISIAGVVSFRSTDSLSLPLNTTKRGLDTSSDVYHIVLDYMREGLKKFTSFTNAWKRREEETEEDFSKLHREKPADVAKLVDEEKFTETRKHKGKGSARYYSPDLPKPTKTQKQRRISFSADREDIEIVAEYFFNSREADRSEVGKRCFQESLQRAREAQQ